MKQKDLAMILVVVFISAIFSLVLSKQIFVSPKERRQSVEVVTPINDKFEQPDKHYFNNESFDPTRLITIGQNANPDPFSATTH